MEKKLLVERDSADHVNSWYNAYMIYGSSKKRRKPKKLTLSPTKINTFLACRVMYKYTYIDRISRFYYKPKPYHSFGASVHRALEDYHKKGGPETQSAEQLIESMRQVWTSAGYASPKEELEHAEAAVQFLEEYHTAHKIEGVKTLFTEKQFRTDMGEFIIMGRIDRLDVHPDGHLEVIDYKSGRMCVSEDEVRNDLAMGIYAFLVQKAYPDNRVSASIYCLRSGDKATAQYSIEDLAQIEDAVRGIAIEIEQIDEYSIIEPVWLERICPNCDYLRLCAKRQNWDLSKLL